MWTISKRTTAIDLATNQIATTLDTTHDTEPQKTVPISETISAPPTADPEDIQELEDLPETIATADDSEPVKNILETPPVNRPRGREFTS